MQDQGSQRYRSMRRKPEMNKEWIFFMKVHKITKSLSYVRHFQFHSNPCSRARVLNYSSSNLIQLISKADEYNQESVLDLLNVKNGT